MAGIFTARRSNSSLKAQGRFSSAAPSTNKPQAIKPQPNSKAATGSCSARSIK
ncbi:hypothetical protein D3C81_2029350 [compost metagenome]